VLVIIPAYKERGAIEKLIDDVSQSESVREIILVNDSPSEEFTPYYNSLKNPKLRVIHHDFNKGKDMAIKTAIDATSDGKIIVLDADLHNVKPEQLDKVSELLDHYEVVSLIRGVDNSLARLVGTTYMMLGEHAFRRSFVEKFKDRLFTDIRWTFDNEFNSLVLSNAVKAKYVELNGVHHTMKGDKYGLWDGIIHDLKMVYEVIILHYKVFGYITQRIQLQKFLKDKEVI